MARRTFVVIDGENIDATLGVSILHRAPKPAERPRWERVLEFAQELWGQETVGLFFLNVRDGHLPGPFIQALQNMNFRPVPLSGPQGTKVVDVGIQRTLDALGAHDADVLLCSHDRDFVEQMQQLQADGRRLALVGFPEFVSGAYADIGLTMYDLETEVLAFNQPLARIRVIPVDEFRPEAFLY